MTKTPRFLQTARPVGDAASEIRSGLLAQTPFIAPKYFYDRLGSHLFAAITELPEYYPTRTEASIFAKHAAEMARASGAPGQCLIDLGAGDCAKAASLFGAFRPARYLAVDISVEYLKGSLQALQREFPDMDMLGLGLDFSSSLALPDDLPRGHRLFFYPGSSIGNFTPGEAVAFLRRVKQQCGDGGSLLIGVDLRKGIDVLVPAYDDAVGVTAAFNLNMLRHVNRLAGTDFDVAHWQHVALFEEVQGRIEMHVQARRDVVVRWPGGERSFSSGERIHTENSYKYTRPQIESMLREAGFRDVRTWTDEREWFAVMLAKG